MSAATKLRQKLEQSTDLIVAPGVYDGFSARIALQVGFDCLYMVRAFYLYIRLAAQSLSDRSWHDCITSRTR